MNRRIAIILLAMVVVGVGCLRKTDSVLATFICPKFSTTRMILYSSGTYELYLVEDGIPRHPYEKSVEYHFRRGHFPEAWARKRPMEMGSFIRGPTNLVVTVKQSDISPDPPGRKVYRVITHDGTEYLSDERWGWAQKYEETKDFHMLRYAWMQEKR